MSMTWITSDDWVTALKAAAEPTRLRLLMLLAAGEWNVKDLTVILGQSQPRLSRHLKLLAEAGLVERFREGSSVYFHLSDRSRGQRLALRLLESVDPNDAIIRRDSERADAVKREREAAAQAFFRDHAGEWDRIRALHVAESEVEAAMRRALGTGPFNLLVDLGTGTGRILELFAQEYERGLGVDVNQSMLAYARSRLSKAGHTKSQVRHGDIYNLALADQSADVVTMHQVLHFLADPRRAVEEAARILAPGGKLLIVDFAPHEFEALREREAHGRLGFSQSVVAQWLTDCGLEMVSLKALEPARETPEKLTVQLWLAARPLNASTAKAKSTPALDPLPVLSKELPRWP
jgi:ubiquinone/menaquinone biosynthesis C-methylase UbiE/DNA-binding HxlR family transcriptional regulator